MPLRTAAMRTRTAVGAAACAGLRLGDGKQRGTGSGQRAAGGWQPGFVPSVLCCRFIYAVFLRDRTCAKARVRSVVNGNRSNRASGGWERFGTELVRRELQGRVGVCVCADRRPGRGGIPPEVPY